MSHIDSGRRTLTRHHPSSQWYSANNISSILQLDHCTMYGILMLEFKLIYKHRIQNVLRNNNYRLQRQDGKKEWERNKRSLGFIYRDIHSMCHLVFVHLRREEMGVRPGNPRTNRPKQELNFFSSSSSSLSIEVACFLISFLWGRSGPAREVTLCVLYAFLLVVIYSPSLDRKEVCVKVESDWRKNEPIRENGIVRPQQLSKCSTDAHRDLLIR